MATLKVEKIDEIKEKRAVERILNLLLVEKLDLPAAERILDKTKRIMEGLK